MATTDAWRCVQEHVQDKDDQFSNRLICKEASLAYPEPLIKKFKEREEDRYLKDFPWEIGRATLHENDPHIKVKEARNEALDNYYEKYLNAINAWEWKQCPELIRLANQAVWDAEAQMNAFE